MTIMFMSDEGFDKWCEEHTTHREPHPLNELDPEQYRDLRNARKHNEQIKQQNFPTLPGIPVLIDRSGLEYEANEVIDKVLRKNKDYGDAWQALGKVGATARFVDKLFRIEHLANGQEALVVDEKLEDTLQDLVGYGLLILMYKREKG